MPELYNIDYAQADVAAKAVAENADLVHRHQGAHERERHRQARAGAAASAPSSACEIAGTGAKVMCHIGGRRDAAS